MSTVERFKRKSKIKISPNLIQNQPEIIVVWAWYQLFQIVQGLLNICMLWWNYVSHSLSSTPSIVLDLQLMFPSHMYKRSHLRASLGPMFIKFFYSFCGFNISVILFLINLSSDLLGHSFLLGYIYSRFLRHIQHKPSLWLV